VHYDNTDWTVITMGYSSNRWSSGFYAM